MTAKSSTAMKGVSSAGNVAGNVASDMSMGSMEGIMQDNALQQMQLAVVQGELDKEKAAAGAARDAAAKC